MSTTNKDTSEPAFPGGLYEHQYAGSNDRAPYNEGMTLRDYFAGQALAGLAACDDFKVPDHMPLAYEIADAMLEARKQ